MNHNQLLDDILVNKFQYQSFRPGQKEIIQDVMSGKDVLGILPTGSGKSICYQLPSVLFPGITIVVSPLIALMVDQVKQLKAKQFKAVIALNSFIPMIERKRVYRTLHKYKLIYVSPELLQQEEFLTYLKNVSVSLMVIDEAHCISQWGHEFRPDYMKLQNIIQLLHEPPVLALSATATPIVQKDIMQSLNKQTMAKHIYPIDKPNIVFMIQRVAQQHEKLAIIIDILSQFNVPTLIYFSSRLQAEIVAHQLSIRLGHRRVAFYHGGMEQVDRIAIQQQFMNDQLNVICCTSAFGMGIDKSNIRLIIHYHMPTQLESFVQEAGRAGRDGKTSVSLLLYAENDEFLPKQIVKSELPNFDILDHAFWQLQNLYLANEEIPENETKLEQLFSVNEVQWRFMYSQFEKHGMIKNNKIFYHETKWLNIYEEVKQLIEKRMTYKQAKLTEMLNWIHERGCLRKALYRPFQSSYTPTDYCCSNCGFQLDQWIPIQTMVEERNEQSWRNKLKSLLFIGEEDETKSIH